MLQIIIVQPSSIEMAECNGEMKGNSYNQSRVSLLKESIVSPVLNLSSSRLAIFTKYLFLKDLLVRMLRQLKRWPVVTALGSSSTLLELNLAKSSNSSLMTVGSNLCFSLVSKWTCISLYLLKIFMACSLRSSSLLLRMKQGLVSSNGSISAGSIWKKDSTISTQGWYFLISLRIRSLILESWPFLDSSDTMLVNSMSIWICVASRLIKDVNSGGNLPILLFRSPASYEWLSDVTSCYLLFYFGARGSLSLACYYCFTSKGLCFFRKKVPFLGGQTSTPPSSASILLSCVIGLGTAGVSSLTTVNLAFMILSFTFFSLSRSIIFSKLLMPAAISLLTLSTFSLNRCISRLFCISRSLGLGVEYLESKGYTLESNIIDFTSFRWYRFIVSGQPYALLHFFMLVQNLATGIRLSRLVGFGGSFEDGYQLVMDCASLLRSYLNRSGFFLLQANPVWAGPAGYYRMSFIFWASRLLLAYQF